MRARVLYGDDITLETRTTDDTELALSLRIRWNEVIFVVVGLPERQSN